MTMDIVMSGEYQKAHFARAIALVNGPSRRGTALRAVLAILFAAGYGYLLYEYVTGGERGAVWLGRRAISLIVVAYVLFAPYVRNWQLARRLWKETQSDPSVSARLSVQGLTFLPSAADVQFTWEAFSRLNVEDDMIVLTMPDGTFAVLPRTFFASDEEWQRARLLVQSRVKPSQAGTA